MASTPPSRSHSQTTAVVSERAYVTKYHLAAVSICLCLVQQRLSAFLWASLRPRCAAVPSTVPARLSVHPMCQRRRRPNEVIRRGGKRGGGERSGCASRTGSSRYTFPFEVSGWGEAMAGFFDECVWLKQRRRSAERYHLSCVRV